LEKNNFIDSKFRLVIIAAKRAKQLVRGSKPKVNLKAENPLTIALKEIDEGKIDFKIINDKDKIDEIDSKLNKSEDLGDIISETE
jgi:DNA-directed RNA polymerase subunit omega